MIGVGVGAVVILGAVFYFASGGTKSGAPAQTPSAAQAPAAQTPPAAQPVASTPAASGAGRAGKPATQPAPEPSAATMAECEKLYERAKQLWNQSQTARTAGNTDEFRRLIHESWDVCETLSAKVRPQMDWLEHADLEGWAVPGSIVAFERRLLEWQELRTKVKKVKPIDRG